MTRPGFALLLQRRIGRRDLPLLAVMALLTAIALVCALGAPLLLARTLDAAAQQAVAAAGPDADVLVQSKVGRPGQEAGDDAAPPIEPGDVVTQAQGLRTLLPLALQRVVRPVTAAVVGPELHISRSTGGELGVQIALLTRPDAVRLRSGALPSTDDTDDTDDTVDVVLSPATADAASLRVGSVIDVPAEAGLLPGARLRLRVTGIVDRRAVAGPSPWTDDGPVWSARENDSGAAPLLELTALTDVAGITRATAALGHFTAALRLHVDPNRVTASGAPAIRDAVTRLRSYPDDLAGGSGTGYTVRSTLPEALAQAEQQAVSASAQTSLLTTGVLGTAAVALVLIGGLLAGRRRDPIALQRARGASVLAVAVPPLAESAVLVLLAAAVAVLVTGSAGSAGGVVVVVVALLATPVRIALAARGDATRRAPANRSDRARLVRLRQARRVALEAGLVLVAVVAVLVLQSGDGLGSAGSDPLLVAAPLLAAAALTVVLLRLLPPVVAGVSTLARRSRGVAGVLVTSRSSGARIALPMLALCIAFGLALNDGMLVSTIAAGQEAASWERIGADARATTPAGVSRISGAPGVRSASAVAELPGISANLATTSAIVTVLGVDAGYAAVAGAQPAAAPGTAAVLRRLGDPSGTVPVVVGADLARSMAGRTLQLQLDGRIIPARAVGTVATGPSGYLDGPFVLVDLPALQRRVPGVRPNSVLAIGPGAAVAMQKAGIPAKDIRTRSDWLATQRAAPLVAGTRLATLLAALLLAVFAVAALSAALLAGAPERRRVLSLLRTLGMRRRTGWWLLVGDLLPLVVSGVVGGTAIGVLAAELFDPALAIAGLTGGTTDPPVTISGAVLLGMIGATVVVLAIAVGTEALTWRRDRIAEVLRVGGRDA